MILTILNESFEITSIVDTFRSLIWTQRYNEYGDFELYVPVSVENLKIFKLNYYITIKESNAIMIIEKISIESDVENGQILAITGRSLESILGRRVTQYKVTYKQNIAYFVNHILSTNIVSPAVSERRIPNFVVNINFGVFPGNVDLEWDVGSNVYSIINEVCFDNDVGFRITLDDDNNFVFELYKGQDRSYDQFDNPYVIFSSKYDNLIKSQYIENLYDYKNTVYAYSDDAPFKDEEHEVVQGGATFSEYFYTNNKPITGLRRREMYFSTTSISPKYDNGDYLHPGTYETIVKTNALKELKPCENIKAFEGEIDASIMFIYGEDFFLGDIIQIEDEYGNTAKARITEITLSQEIEGTIIYPTFSIIEDKEE